MLRAIVALVIAVLLPSAAYAEARIALLMTNQAYRQPGAALTNTHRDGEILKAALEKVGFKVWVAKDTANEGALLLAIDEHVQRLTAAGPDAVGFFYYSGHGAADRPNGENFLIPTDMPITRADQLPLMAARLDRIMATLSTAGRMSFVVFDACRNVPLQRTDKSPFKGFAPVREQNGLLIAFATEPGNVAIDNNRYAKALAEELVKPGQEAAEVFRRVRQRVRVETQQAQSPEYTDRRDYGFHFVAAVAQPPKQPDPVASQPPSGQPRFSEAAEAWSVTKDTQSIAALEAFIRRFGDSYYGDLAKQRLGDLKQTHEAARLKAERDRLALLEQAKVQKGVQEKPSPRPAQGSNKEKWVTGDAQWDDTPNKPPPRPPQASKKEKLVSGEAQWDVPPKVPPSTSARCDGVEASIGSGSRCLKPGDSFKECDGCPEMVVVPAGSFMMGSPESEAGREKNEGPQRKVTIARPFAVGKYEVTFAEWDACVAAGGCKHNPNDGGWGRSKRPVIYVSWDDIIKEYLPWLSRRTGKTYRLLSEAEWEYAARGSASTSSPTQPYWWGGQPSHEYANYGNDGLGRKEGRDQWEHTAPVGQFPANLFGLHDMHGNAYEWVQDCLNDSYRDAPTDGTAWTIGNCTLRLTRGGAWLHSWKLLRSASRSYSSIGFKYNDIGFRVARTLN